MQSTTTRLLEFFDLPRQYRVPVFQRPYTWPQQRLATLWSDLMALYATEQPAVHFTGTIVTAPVATADPAAVPCHLVVDGQQRLTTLAILLCAVRDRANVLGDAATAGICTDLLVNRHYPHSRQKLLPTQHDRAAFTALIESRTTTPPGGNVTDAYAFFERALKTPCEPDGDLIDLPRLVQTIRASLVVVSIALDPNVDDPYLIFESLNAKGEPLQQSDLIRNYVLSRFNDSSLDAAHEAFWRPLEERLGESLTPFFRHYALQSGVIVAENRTFACTRNALENRDRDGVQSWLAEVGDAARDYSSLLAPQQEADAEIRVWLERLAGLESTVFAPLLLKLFAGLRAGTVQRSEVVAALAALESFQLRRLVCSVPTNSLAKICRELCAKLPARDPAGWLVERLALPGGSWRWPSDAEFRAALAGEPLYGRKHARFVLVELERALAQREVVDVASATIEHVLPQTLTSEWLAELGRNPESVAERWTHTLGNLTLTAYNGTLGNAAFSVKRAELSRAKFELTRSIVEQRRWREHQIRSRGEQLADLAVVRWPKPTVIENPTS